MAKATHDNSQPIKVRADEIKGGHTLYFLGAGASIDYLFPSGPDLKKILAKKLQVGGSVPKTGLG